MNEKEIKNQQNTTESPKNDKSKPTDNKQAKAEKKQKNSPDTAESSEQQQPSIEELQKQIQQLKQQLEQLNDKYLRLAAEYDNYRKRTLKEKAELIKTASERVLIDLLPIIDDFDRAMEHINKASDIEALKQGIQLIYNQFKNFLKKQGVQEIQAIGQKLDTDLHEAVQQVPATDPDQKGKIVHVIQKGYKLNDKVIRHAKVVVAM